MGRGEGSGFRASGGLGFGMVRVWDGSGGPNPSA